MKLYAAIRVFLLMALSPSSRGASHERSLSSHDDHGTKPFEKFFTRAKGAVASPSASRFTDGFDRGTKLVGNFLTRAKGAVASPSASRFTDGFDRGTKLFGKFFTQAKRAVASPSASRFTDGSIYAGYCTGCASWPKHSSMAPVSSAPIGEAVKENITGITDPSSMALISSAPLDELVKQFIAEPSSNALTLSVPIYRPAKQVIADPLFLPPTAPIHTLSSKLQVSQSNQTINEKRPVPELYDDTWYNYQQRIISTLVLLSMAAYNSRSKKASGEKGEGDDAKRILMREEFDSKFEIGLAPIGEGDESVEDSPANNGAAIDESDDDKSYVLSDEPPAKEDDVTVEDSLATIGAAVAVIDETNDDESHTLNDDESVEDSPANNGATINESNDDKSYVLSDESPVKEDNETIEDSLATIEAAVAVIDEANDDESHTLIDEPPVTEDETVEGFSTNNGVAIDENNDDKSRTLIDDPLVAAECNGTADEEEGIMRTSSERAAAAPLNVTAANPEELQDALPAVLDKLEHLLSKVAPNDELTRSKEKEMLNSLESFLDDINFRLH